MEKNTEQFYGIFYVNICGNICSALIIAKKYDNICCWKEYCIFYGIFYANISENICGA